MAMTFTPEQQETVNKLVFVFGEALAAEMAYRTSLRDDNLRDLGHRAGIAFLVSDAEDVSMRLRVESRARANSAQRRRDDDAWLRVFDLMDKRQKRAEAEGRIICNRCGRVHGSSMDNTCPRCRIKERGGVWAGGCFRPIGS